MKYYIIFSEGEGSSLQCIEFDNIVDANEVYNKGQWYDPARMATIVFQKHCMATEAKEMIIKHIEKGETEEVAMFGASQNWQSGQYVTSVQSAYHPMNSAQMYGTSSAMPPLNNAGAGLGTAGAGGVGAGAGLYDLVNDAVAKVSKPKPSGIQKAVEALKNLGKKRP